MVESYNRRKFMRRMGSVGFIGMSSTHMIGTSRAADRRSLILSEVNNRRAYYKLDIYHYDRNNLDSGSIQYEGERESNDNIWVKYGDGHIEGYLNGGQDAYSFPGNCYIAGIQVTGYSDYDTVESEVVIGVESQSSFGSGELRVHGWSGNNNAGADNYMQYRIQSNRDIEKASKLEWEDRDNGKTIHGDINKGGKDFWTIHGNYTNVRIKPRGGSVEIIRPYFG